MKNQKQHTLLSFLLSVLLILTLWPSAKANTYGGMSNRHHVVTVNNALKLQHESHVTVRGYITGSVGPEHYNLKDNTGSIVVMITSEVWDGLTVDSDTKIEVQGFMDREGKDIPLRIDADFVRIAK